MGGKLVVMDDGMQSEKLDKQRHEVGVKLCIQGNENICCSCWNMCAGMYIVGDIERILPVFENEMKDKFPIKVYVEHSKGFYPLFYD